MRPPQCAPSLSSERPVSLIIEQCEDEQGADGPTYRFRRDQESFTEFILDYPRGAYTGMRTINRGAIVEFESHMKRITNSLSLMNFQKDPATFESETAVKRLQPYRDPELFKARFLPLLQKGLREYYDTVGATTEGETKVSIVAAYSLEAEQMFFAAHFAPLQEPRQEQVKVKVEEKSRSNPVVKDSQWVRDREELEETKPKDVNEIILTDDHDNIYEGLASNFFAVRLRDDGSPALVCASLEHILLGTMMKILVAVCEKHQISIDWVFPTLNDAKAGKWLGCFLTSTSRLLVPIETIYHKNESIEFSETAEIITFLRRELVKEMAHRAYKIL